MGMRALSEQTVGASGSPATTKGDLHGFSTVDARIPIGTNDHVLTADSAQALGLKWAAAAGGSSPLTTKGDLYGFSTVDARLPVGTNTHVLTADSAEGLGVKWAAAAAAGSDWTDVVLAAHLTIQTITVTDTLLKFTPADSTLYEIIIQGMVRSATVDVGAQVGIAWPSAGVDDGSFILLGGQLASNVVHNVAPTGVDTKSNTGGAFTSTLSGLTHITGLLKMTTGATGDFIVTFRGENATQEVTLRAGSILRYRVVA